VFDGVEEKGGGDVKSAMEFQCKTKFPR